MNLYKQKYIIYDMIYGFRIHFLFSFWLVKKKKLFLWIEIILIYLSLRLWYVKKLYLTGENYQLSNADKFPHNHDEIDIELLGHDKRNDWVIQTNVYANGSVRTGREEKFYLWFDPTQQHHYYSILWNSYHTV